MSGRRGGRIDGGFHGKKKGLSGPGMGPPQAEGTFGAGVVAAALVSLSVSRGGVLLYSPDGVNRTLILNSH